MGIRRRGCVMIEKGVFLKRKEPLGGGREAIRLVVYYAADICMYIGFDQGSIYFFERGCRPQSLRDWGIEITEEEAKKIIPDMEIRQNFDARQGSFKNSLESWDMLSPLIRLFQQDTL